MTSRRKLSAILSADAAGYSRLMADDEAATVRALNEARALFGERIQAHGGRVVDTAGDSVLAEFPSAVEAVDCSSQIQHDLAKCNAQLAEHRRMQFRIGINLGDVIEQEDGTIYGDGVNVAARLQALAESGGICISGTAFDQVEGKLPLQYKFIGEQQVKNISKPVRAYKALLGHAEKKQVSATRPGLKRSALLVAAALVLMGAFLTIWKGTLSPSAPNQPEQKRALQLPEGPSLAVLPFQNMSGKPDEEWFSDGMTETLITDLSRLKNLFVIARNSSFTYKGKSVDVRQVGRELGVRYVLEGSVQRTSERLRINAQLIEASTGRHLWAERYDRKLADLFDIQDDLTQHIVTALDATLLEGEQARTWRKATRNREAYDLYLKGREHHARFTREDMAKAQASLQQALDLDPKFTMPMVWLGWTHYVQGDSGWSPDPKESYRKAVALGRRAVAIDPSLGDAYAMMANVLLTMEKHHEALDAAERALAVSPNQADVFALAAWAFAQNGRANEAVSLMERAFRRNPFPPEWYYGSLGDSLLFAKRIEDALPAQRKCVENSPDFLWCQLGLAVTYVEAGKLEQATVHTKEAMRINPKISAADNTYVRSIGDTNERARIVESLRRAGLR